jgi:uncharacterized protein YjbJ (UPF0337 family)
MTHFDTQDGRPSEQARKGLAASIGGKLKEVTGAVFGNDSLAAECRLQQAEAAARKDAVAKDAIAGAEAREAAGQLAQESAAAQRQRLAVEQEAQRKVEAVEQRGEMAEAAAKLEAERIEASRKTEAELKAQRDLDQVAAEARREHATADLREQEATDKFVDEQDKAAAAERAAARARADADAIADRADLPTS